MKALIGRDKREERGKGRRAIMGVWPAIYIKQVTTRSSTRTTSVKGAASGGGGGREEVMLKVKFRGRGATQCKASCRRRTPRASPEESFSRPGAFADCSFEKRKWRLGASASVLKPIVFKVRRWHRAALESYWVRRYGG